MKKLKVTVDGTVYEVTLESTEAGATETAAAAAPAATGGNQVVSPLAATIVGIDAQVGQSVAAGDRLFTLEAMKMNSYVTAESAGKVTSILVKTGDQVTEGQALLEMA
ncbi:MAG: acetyl-CoA carboxylase biotin carboxyl carrier protein subunit [Opitutales bacterium]|nr:acetyl-CoA carboxylase biotin carboxyl carrier protein subunit [Opitutales bacterium]